MDQSELISALTRIQNDVAGLLDKLQPAAVAKSPDTPTRQIIWGAKVTTLFKESVLWIEDQLGLKADNLMACMAFESGATFSPSVKNAAGSSGTGLIQFMSSTAQSLGTTTAELAAMSAEKQLGFVYKYFRKFGADLSHWGLGDTYMAILYPAAIGKADDWCMPWDAGSLAYKQNAGLDLNKDHKITKAEAYAGVSHRYELGKQFMG